MTYVTSATWGTVYLLHFAVPLGNMENPRAQASHYIGWALDLEARLADHRSGRGAAITRAAVERGIAFDVVRTWSGPMDLEKQLKRRKQGPDLCPVCRAHRRGGRCDHQQLQLDLGLPPGGTLADDAWELPEPPARRSMADRFEWLLRRAWRLARRPASPSPLLDLPLEDW